MKGYWVAVLAGMLSLLLHVGAQLAEPTAKTLVKGPGAKKGADPSTPTPLAPPVIPQSSSTTTPTSSPTSSTPSISSTSCSTCVTYTTTTNTIDVFSFMTSSSSIPYSSKASSTSVAAAASYTGVDSSMNSASSPSSSSHSLVDHRTLIIILSSVLGFVGLLLIAAALFLAYRCSQGRTPFGHRSATPLDDDEIESWRGTVIEQKQQPTSVDPATLNRKGDSIQLISSPGWTWTASPTSQRSALSPSTTIPDTPAFLAKAPNSRAGLTDETVPGADPFIPPMKRQSSRLSKAPPGHYRSKSRRSSMSAKSIWSYNGGIGPHTDSRGTNDKMPIWFDPEDQAVGKELSRTDGTSSSPATSVYDVSAGGLSPRPKSQARPWEMDKEIGRAIA